jgi:hypothetical protein
MQHEIGGTKATFVVARRSAMESPIMVRMGFIGGKETPF